MDEVPETGAVFTFGKSRFGDNNANKFWVKNDPIIKIACGDEHTAVVTHTGRVYTFGSNQWGQLALGHTNQTNKPSFVRSLKGIPIKEISCGRSHTLFASDENVYGCGGNGDNQVCEADEDTITKPYMIAALSRISIVKLSCGVEHSLALGKRGELYLWGSGSEGQLGMGKSVKQILNPTKLKFVDEPIKDADCGYYHTGFVTRSGKAYTFGESEGGKLGLGEELEETYHTPQVVFLVDTAVAISCGNTCSAIRTSSGALYMTGDGQRGQLGFSPKSLDKCVYSFTKVPCIPIKYVAVGESHTAVISQHGQLYTFGDGRHGKLCMGEDNFTSLTSPQLVHTFNEVATVIDVSCGGCHTMVVAKPSDPQDALPESPPRGNIKAPLQDMPTPEVKSSGRTKRQRIKGENKENERELPVINAVQVKTVESAFIEPKDKKVKFIDKDYNDNKNEEDTNKLKEEIKKPKKVQIKKVEEKQEESGSETDEPGASSDEDSEEDDDSDDDSINKRFSENIMSIDELPEITPTTKKVVEATPVTPVVAPVKTPQKDGGTPYKSQPAQKTVVSPSNQPTEDSDSYITVTDEEETEDEDDSEEEEVNGKKEEVKTLVSGTPKHDATDNNDNNKNSKDNEEKTQPEQNPTQEKTDVKKEAESKPSRFAFWKKKTKKKETPPQPAKGSTATTTTPTNTTTPSSDQTADPTTPTKGTHQSSKACTIL